MTSALGRRRSYPRGATYTCASIGKPTLGERWPNSVTGDYSRHLRYHTVRRSCETWPCVYALWASPAASDLVETRSRDCEDTVQPDSNDANCE